MARNYLLKLKMEEISLYKHEKFPDQLKLITGDP